MRKLGPEAAKAQERRLKSGFVNRYLLGDAVLDIGYRGGNKTAEPVTEKAIGVELDYPGYDGKRLPFDDCSQDAVFVSHCLEHISDYATALKDWYRVLKIGGFLIIAVPHQYLYERKASLPSRFNGDHKRFYTPASLMREVEESIPVDAYRVRTLADIDEGFDYNLAADEYPKGSYEIELVIEKIERPVWGPSASWKSFEILAAKRYAQIIIEYASAIEDGRMKDQETLVGYLLKEPIAFVLYKPYLPAELVQDLPALLSSIIPKIPFDHVKYLARHLDLATVYKNDAVKAHKHFINHGYFESRALK